MGEERFEGTFVTPSMGVARAPIPIAGAGRLVLEPTGLRAVGFAPGTALVAVAVTLATVAAALAAGWAVTHLIFHAAMSSGAVGGSIGAGVVAGMSMPRRPSTRPVELVFPWAAVAKVALDPQVKGRVQITIADHAPKGVLHFVPADAQALVTRLALARTA